VSYRRAKDLLGRLVVDFPAVADQTPYRSHLASCQHNLGRVLVRAGRPRDAEPEQRAALETRQERVAAIRKPPSAAGSAPAACRRQAVVDPLCSTADLMSFKSCRMSLFMTPLNNSLIGIDISRAAIPCGRDS